MSKIYEVTLDISDEEYNGGFCAPGDKYFPSFKGRLVVGADGIIRGYVEEEDERLDGDKRFSCLFGLLAEYDANSYSAVFGKITAITRFSGICFLGDIKKPETGVWYDQGAVYNMMGYLCGNSSIVLAEQPYRQEEEKAIIERFENRFKNDKDFSKHGLDWIDMYWLDRCEHIIKCCKGKRIHADYNTLTKYEKSGATQRKHAKLAGEKDYFDLE